MNTELPIAGLRYLALAGPTASGKTAAALAIARQHAVEIISVDSALVYRGMDIGTAKPSAAELAAVPHHLINIRDPLRAYSAAEFVRDARALIADITARGKLALLVGGTMLYFKALFDGLDDMPSADAAVRAALELEAQAKGWPALHAELAMVDPVTAARLQPADSQRIARALEVFRISGQPLSSFHTTKNVATNQDASKATGQNNHKYGSFDRFDAVFEPADGSGGNRNATTNVATNQDTSMASGQNDHKDGVFDQFGAVVEPTCGSGGNRDGVQQEKLLISLEPQDRAWLHQRIAARFDAMLAGGFLDEVKALRARGDLHPDLPSMRCVGYRQAWQALDGDWPMEQLREKGIIATRQLAKRQITWLRSMPQRRVVACDAPDALEQVLALARLFVEGRV